MTNVFLWHGKLYRFAQGRKGGTIYVAHGCCSGMIYRAYCRRCARRARGHRVSPSTARWQHKRRLRLSAYAGDLTI